MFKGEYYKADVENEVISSLSCSEIKGSIPFFGLRKTFEKYHSTKGLKVFSLRLLNNGTFCYSFQGNFTQIHLF